MPHRVINIQPEDDYSMMSRYSDALRTEWVFEQVIVSGRPSRFRTHVFDFEKGFRLIIYKARIQNKIVCPVFIGCVYPNSEYYNTLEKIGNQSPQRALKKIKKWTRDHYTTISQNPNTDYEYWGFTATDGFVIYFDTKNKTPMNGALKT
jgi:hypothetical protein